MQLRKANVVLHPKPEGTDFSFLYGCLRVTARDLARREVAAIANATQPVFFFLADLEVFMRHQEF